MTGVCGGDVCVGVMGVVVGDRDVEVMGVGRRGVNSVCV